MTSRVGGPAGKPRRGATAVETAVVLLTLATLVIGMFELSIAVFRYNNVSNAARRIARAAIVRGRTAPAALGNWGPSEYSGTGGDSGPIADGVRPHLIGLDLDTTDVLIQWPGGDAVPGSPVRVTVSTRHAPATGFLFTSAWTLSARSQMPIAH